MKKYENFSRHLQVLRKADQKDLGDEFIISGIIDKFLVQFELSWKLFKELLRYEGSAASATGSPRTIIKEAFQYYDFLNEDMWLDMLKSRNSMAHIYDEALATELVHVIIDKYIPELIKMDEALKVRYGSMLYEDEI